MEQHDRPPRGRRRIGGSPDAACDDPRDPAALAADALLDHPSFASTLANGLAVLGCFSATEALLGNKDFAQRLGLSKPTISRLSFTLVALGYLRRDAATGKYRLGPAVLSLGYPLLTQLAIRQAAAAEMLELARHARGPVSVGVRDRLQVVYVETTVARQSNATRPGIGSARPLLRTAIGRALLHACAPAERAALERRLQQAQPEEWQLYGARLPQAYEEIERLGFCAVTADWRPTLAGVAVPMRIRLEGLPAAFNLTVPTYTADSARLSHDLGPRLVELVRTVESRLGA